jgi:hypothetical protein
VIFRRLPRCARAVAGAALAGAVAVVPGCSRPVEGVPTAAPSRDLPTSAARLEPLIVASVPSGLPRLPDERLSPPAGAKTAADVASYADDPARERKVLAEFGYRFGWERFWGYEGGQLTGVFVDQFESREGAADYAADLAENDAEQYRGMLEDDPPDLPGGCQLLTVRHPQPADRLPRPTVMVWCAHGVFSVGVTAMADTVNAASSEVHAVLRTQLGRLPTA